MRRRRPVVEAVVKEGLLWAQMGSGGLRSDLPPRHHPGSDVVSGPPRLFLLHEGVRGFDLRHGGGGRLLRRRWLTGVL
jgi:hypothetical protein